MRVRHFLLSSPVLLVFLITLSLANWPPLVGNRLFCLLEDALSTWRQFVDTTRNEFIPAVRGGETDRAR